MIGNDFARANASECRPRGAIIGELERRFKGR